MRLSEQQVKIIKEKTIEVFGEDALVYLFGSRLDDNAKGGDIDLLVKVDKDIDRPAVLPARLAAKIMLANNGLKTDVLLIANNLEKQVIHKIALKNGVLL